MYEKLFAGQVTKVYENYSAKAIRILAKGYLPISLITPLKLKEIVTSVKEY